MQKKTSLLSLIGSYFDMAINAFSIYLAYFLLSLINNEPPYYPSGITVTLQIIAVVVFASIVNQANNNYNLSAARPQRQAAWNMIKTGFITFSAVTICIAFFGEDGSRTSSLTWALTSLGISTVLLFIKQRMVFFTLRRLRKKQFMLKRTLIVGDNAASIKEYVHEIINNPNSGIMILGYVGDKIDTDVGCEKLGTVKDFTKILNTQRPTDVVFAIDSYDKRHLIKLVNLCDDRCIRVYFLPVIYGFFKSPKQIEQIGNVPIINAHTNPLSNRFNAFLKRTIDIVGSLALIAFTSPLMIIAAVGTKLTSDGPILFKQERVGRMGKRFTMYKFRSMPVNRDTENNWSAPGDARPTRFGSFLRRTAIDELPQFFNVLMGQMSLVGPRPEMPKYVEEFRNTIPLYMVKHYVKPGITGLAQIKGLRGDTSLEERIQEDIHYIENWSLGLDIMILLKTPFKAFNKNEQYVKRERRQGGIIGAIESKIKVIYGPGERTEKANQKILYAASTYSHIKSFHLRYIDALRADGHTVMTMASGAGADFDIPFEKRMLSSKNRKCRAQIKKILAREGFDLIILNTSLAAFHIRLALHRKKRPRVVNIVHGYLFSESARGIRARLRSSLLYTAEKMLRSKTDAILTMNDEDFRMSTKSNLAKGAIIPTFGMGVPEPKTTPKLETLRAENSKPGEFVMLFVGELSARKNQIFLIRALPELKKLIPNVRLWLVGDGDALDELREEAKRQEVSDIVNFFGKRKNPADFMSACDLYVSSSLGEGLPFNIVEALGCGKPVLASNVKGHRDILAGGMGTLFTPGSKKEFCRKVVDIHNGNAKISEKKIYFGYKDFSMDTVFYDTYEKLKEAAWL